MQNQIIPAFVQQNIAYGPSPLQQMDVSLVANRNSETPLVVLIHGGGWMAGDKKDADIFKTYFLSKGINVVNINYRLANASTIHYKEIMDDVNSALNYILKQANTWHIRNKNIVFWGGSAGGHIALLYAYSYDIKNAVSSVISLGGPTALNDRATLNQSSRAGVVTLLPLITGASWSDDSFDPAYALASPYYGKHFKPSLLINGSADTLVSPLQGKIMSDKLSSLGIDNQYFLIEHGGHGGEGASAAVSDSLNKTVVQWIKRYSN